jgi:hypothetical protein
MENISMYTGGLGAFGVFAYISEQEDVTYEKSMKECLQEKGYDLIKGVKFTQPHDSQMTLTGMM